MTRLQKKCLIAAAGTHLLVIVVLLCSGFITSKPKVDDTQLLDVIPANLVDAAMTSGAKEAPTPPPVTEPPKPVVTPPTPPVPEPPKPVVTPPPPKVEPVTPPEVKPVAKAEIPIAKPPKPTPPKIKVNLEPVVRNSKQVADDKAAADAAAAKAERLKADRLKAFQTAARSIKNNSSTATTVEIKGSSSVSYANYSTVVKSIYDRAWTPPDDMASDDVNTKVSVTISSDGKVVSSRITDRSGDAKVDASVQRALDKVDFVAPFPEGATEKERTFIINFNPQAKRLNG